SFIYKYYSENLNGKYNLFCKKNKIDECVTAYINNKNGKSNIDFAAEVINQIVEYGQSYVMVGDFTKYFDTIDHQLLKDKLQQVLEVDRLSDDWFNVYRSITRYGYYEKEDIERDIITYRKEK